MKKIIFLGMFISLFSNILPQNYLRIYKSDGTVPTAKLNEIDSVTILKCGTDNVYYAGKTYHTVLIGNQCWLKENLDVGTMINDGVEQTNNSTIEKYCYNNVSSNCDTYGGIYQWAEAVNYQNGATNSSSPSPAFSGYVRGICPVGWHIPTSSEFDELYSVAVNGNNLKAVGQGTGIGAGTNTSGFTALLTGGWDSSVGFSGLGQRGAFEVSNLVSPIESGYWYLSFNDPSFSFMTSSKSIGASVRCVMD